MIVCSIIFAIIKIKIFDGRSAPSKKYENGIFPSISTKGNPQTHFKKLKTYSADDGGVSSPTTIDNNRKNVNISTAIIEKKTRIAFKNTLTIPRHY